MCGRLSLDDLDDYYSSGGGKTKFDADPAKKIPSDCYVVLVCKRDHLSCSTTEVVHPSLCNFRERSIPGESMGIIIKDLLK